MSDAEAACMAATILVDEPVPVAIPRVLIADIQTMVAEHFHLPIIEMVSQRRNRAFSHPRQVAMYLARELTPHSLPAIGRCFGRRDHSTAHHAIRQVERRMVSDPVLAADIAAIKKRLLS